MKRTKCLLLALLFLTPIWSCAKEEEYPRPKDYRVEIRLFYEEGDPRAGQEILPGEVITYTYDGKEHGPAAYAYYKEHLVDTEVRMSYSYVDEYGHSTGLMGKPVYASWPYKLTMRVDSDRYMCDWRIEELVISKN